MIKFWPIINSIKEVNFLNEIEELLEIIDIEQFVSFYVLLFKKIAKAIASPHFQVYLHIHQCFR